MEFWLAGEPTASRTDFRDDDHLRITIERDTHAVQLHDGVVSYRRARLQARGLYRSTPVGAQESEVSCEQIGNAKRETHQFWASASRAAKSTIGLAGRDLAERWRRSKRQKTGARDVRRSSNRPVRS